MLSFQEILRKVGEYLPDLDTDLLEKAFSYVNKAHAGQYTVSGDSYVNHCLAVMEILLPLRPDQNTLLATLLHAISESPSYNLKEVEQLFGKDVSNLVSALSVMNKLKSAEQKSEIESLRKMFLVIAQDLRVVLIKLADRLDNMLKLESHSTKERKLIAKETVDIYVPISARLGIYTMKVKLEDLCFQYLYPQQFEDLKDQLQNYILNRGRNIEEIKRELEIFLKGQNIECEVEGRIKGLYSIYKKLKAKSHSTLDDIYDVFAIRVILSNKYDDTGKEVYDHLYSTLGFIHSKWKPLANRFKDYAAVQKPNGYQSLHTAVLGLSPKTFNQPTEIQIRSRRMHDEAENGLASHWFYEENKKHMSFFAKDKLQNVFGKMASTQDWFEALSKIQKDFKDQDIIEALKLDIFSDSIFVFTPDGAVKDLPKGSTPVDFAYAIHSNIGNHCQVAKVNGTVVPLHYQLKNGDVVEIIVNNKSTPKSHWISLVKTSAARNKIRSYLKSLDKDLSFREGKELMNRALIKLNKPILDDELSLFKDFEGNRLSLKERVALIEEIGNGAQPLGQILRKLFGVEKKIDSKKSKFSLREVQQKGKIILPQKKSRKMDKVDDIYIAGEEGLPYRFANCCKPVVDKSIVGYITRGNAVSIHLRNCKLLKDSDPRRVLEASWGKEPDAKKYPIRLSLRARNRVGLVRDIAEVIVGSQVNILDFGVAQYNDKDVSREMTLELTDDEQYKQILERLQRIRNVYEVDKVVE